MEARVSNTVWIWVAGAGLAVLVAAFLAAGFFVAGVFGVVI
jgi:hypothetical protein